MLGKKIFCFLIVTVMISAAFPVWARGGNDLKGMDITIGNFWGEWNVNDFKPQSEVEEQMLEWRRKIQKDGGFTLQEIQISGYNTYMEEVVPSIISGRPAASSIIMIPEWAMALYREGLLYPISDSKAVDFTNSTPVVQQKVAYNQTIRELFTFNGKTYAFGIGYGGSRHSSGIYFNKRLFQEAGLSPDLPYDMQRDGTWTWDNFIDICKKLTRDRNNTGQIDTYALTQDLSTEILDQIVFSNGANYVVKDSSGKFVNATSRPEFLEALQFALRLMDEGIMMPRGPDTAWDWYFPMFHDGRVAMMCESEWQVDRLAEMTDDWGYVLFPRGPRSSQIRFPTDENVYVVPNTFKPAEVDKILTAVNLWFTPLNDDWKAGLWRQYRDSRVINETHAMIRDPRYGSFRNYMLIPGLNRGDIAWYMWYFDGEPAQLVESVSQSWNALISDANAPAR